MTIPEFIVANLPLDNPLVTSVSLFIIFSACNDFFHYLISAVLSWLKRRK